jgi:1,4-dihydroxy-6-naphthoate synthase
MTGTYHGAMSVDTIPIRLAHSPDSDDLVMWWPLVGLDGSKPAIDVSPFQFELIARDVEELNKLAVGGESSQAERYDATAISCAAYPAIADRYTITRCGGSFGEGYGPRVVAKANSGVRTIENLRGKRVAVPGVNTSAFLTLSLLMLDAPGSATPRSANRATNQGTAFEPVEMLFSEIPGAVARGEVDAGLLIHEAQLTFADMGLVEVGNLGELWAERTDLPLPLGLNVIRRDLDDRFGAGTVTRLGEILLASVRYAVDHPKECRAHLQANKGSRTEWDDPELVDRYLSMYVSALTIDMGDRGLAAIRHLLGQGNAAGLCRDAGMIELV